MPPFSGRTKLSPQNKLFRRSRFRNNILVRVLQNVNAMKISRFVLCTSLTLCLSVSATEKLPIFHFVFPTNQSTHMPERQGVFRLEFRNAPFHDFAEALRRCKDEGLMPSFNETKPTLYVYLPSTEMFLKYRKTLAFEARQQFSMVYPHTDLRVRFRVIQTNIKSGEEPSQDSIRSLEITAPAARTIKFSVATVRALIIAFTRSAQTVLAFSQGGSAVEAAMFLILGDASIEFLNVAYTQKLQRAFSEFPLQSVPSRFRTRVRRFINGSFWNLALFSVAHISNPDIPVPNANSILNVLGVSSTGVIFYTLFTNGYSSLRDKGWVSTSQIELTLQIAGLFDLATGIINSNPNWFAYRVFTLGPQWTFYALVALAAKLAPARADRFLAIESTVDWRDVHDEQTADMSFHVNADDDFIAAKSILRGEAVRDDCDRLLIPWQDEIPWQQEPRKNR